MKQVILFFFPLFFITSCDPEPINCEGPQPSWKTCIDGEYHCMEGTVAIPGASDSLGCVPKGFYDFICMNPCPPHSVILLQSRGFKIEPSTIGNNSMSLQFCTDNGVNLKGDWGPGMGETFYANPVPGSQEILIDMAFPISGLYRIWDPIRQDFSRPSASGRINATRDTVFLTYWWGWDAEQDYRENRCDLVFVKADFLK